MNLFTTFEFVPMYVIYSYTARDWRIRVSAWQYILYIIQQSQNNNNNIPMYALTLQLYSYKLDINVC